MLGILLVALVACEPSRVGPAADAATNAATEVTAPARAAALALDARDAGQPPRCRIVMGEGARPNATNAPNVTGRDLGTWRDLDRTTSIVVRTTATARELRLVGPGRVLPCGEDGPAVASGMFASMPGGGEAPGNEQWVGTVCGAVRWITGGHRATVARDGCTLHASNGALFFAPADDVDVTVDETPANAEDAGPSPAPSGGRATRGPDGWWRTDGRVVLRITSAASAASAPGASKDALDSRAAILRAKRACAYAEAREQELATRLGTLGADAGAPFAALGDLTAGHMDVRRAARAVCSTAVAREAGRADGGANGR